MSRLKHCAFYFQSIIYAFLRVFVLIVLLKRVRFINIAELNPEKCEGNEPGQKPRRSIGISIRREPKWKTLDLRINNTHRNVLMMFESVILVYDSINGEDRLFHRNEFRFENKTIIQISKFQFTDVLYSKNIMLITSS